MKKSLLVLLALICAHLARAQNTFTWYNSGSNQWVKLGTLTLPQQGNDAYFKFVGGGGYNGVTSQQGYITMHMRTSNGSSSPTIYPFSAIATSYEPNKFIYDIRIVPNQSGLNPTDYSIYVYCAPYPGGSYFTVESPNGSWATSLAFTGDPGGFSVPFENFINSDTYMTGSLGIGTTNLTGYKLAVGGTLHAQEVKVDMNGWNDAVFDKTYPLPSLTSVNAYINQNHHLPEIPSEAEVIKSGVNVGEMLKLQTKKIEELTLYAIDQQKQIELIKQQDETRIAALEKALASLIANKAPVTNNK